ncbi:DUF4190 domain-containing protein [Paenibacillus sp. sptzw28]|uniref:DUF4190 domain-containing protein n=1 Tax=Paenibacillus sp. sptzw28 TaxID=715179 RepID=UPI001C6E1AB6|nr:DUF4190 domain-containing protein [Paenibacillus sp. sptzw28]QYR20118.1 DUF4190 domain-containing protein [Paenibacillus sp. sptzw28]
MRRNMGHHQKHSADDVSKTHQSLELDSRPYNAEMAAEIAPPTAAGRQDRSRRLRNDAVQETRSAGVATGWSALVLAVMSWFIWPVLLGVSAAVVGYIAFRQGARVLGIWSITLGLIAMLSYLVLIPVYYAIT